MDCNLIKDIDNNWKLETDILVGTYKGKPLYLYITEDTTNGTTWHQIHSNLPFSASDVVKMESYVSNSTDTNVIGNYWSASNNLFRAAVENTSINAEIGSTYPTRPVTVRCFIYHT